MNEQQLIVGERDTFKRKLIRNSCLILVAGMVFSTIFNSITEMHPALTATTAFASFIFAVLYYVAQKNKYLELVKWLLSIISLLLIDMAWITNYGVAGPTIMLVIIYLAYIILIWEKPYVFYYLIIVLSNIAIMFVLEISWPELFSDYMSKKDQVIDNYIGLMISSSLITLFAFSFKNYFNIQSFISQQSDVQKSKFMKNVSHKIRTPLNSIVGFTELITDTNTTQSDKEQYKELIWINSKMLTHLIDNIIDLADIESGQLKMNPSTFNIVRLIENIVNEANTRKIWIGKKNIEINFEKNDFEILVFTDERKMEQIINNLLINALEYCHQGYVTLKCYKDKTKVYVTIADTGIGIRDENLELIFNRFYSWEGDHRNEAPKTGIGLYLTWEIIRQMGGGINVKSKYLHGSTFSLWLPLGQDSNT